MGYFLRETGKGVKEKVTTVGTGFFFRSSDLLIFSGFLI